MSNRILALLILTLVLATIFGTYWYFFVANVASVKIDVGSLTGVTVKLSTEYQYADSVTCDHECILTRVPPVAVSLQASKDGYDATSQSFSLSRGGQKQIRFDLRRTIMLTERGGQKDAKIELIKLKRAIASDAASGSVLPLGVSDGVAYAYSLAPSFSVFSYDDTGSRVVKADIPRAFERVIWNSEDGLMLLMSRDETGVLDLKNGIYTSLKQVTGVQYAKRWPRENLFILRTDDGAMLLDTLTGTITKDGIYDDYVVLVPGKILGLLMRWSTQKMSLLNLPTDGTAKVILQDVATRERRIIYTSPDDLVSIQTSHGEVIVTDSAGQARVLENLQY